MPHYQRYENGVLVEERIATPAELAAEEAALKDQQVASLNIVALRGLFNHENRLRAVVRALRATSTAANTAANNQGVETSRPALTEAEFKAIIKSLL